MATLRLTQTATVELGDTISFTATDLPHGTKNPVIDIAAYQDGELVWSQVIADTASVKLGGDYSTWQANGGPATCVATLQSRVFRGQGEEITTLADPITFSVASTE